MVLGALVIAVQVTGRVGFRRFLRNHLREFAMGWGVLVAYLTGVAIARRLLGIEAGEPASPLAGWSLAVAALVACGVTDIFLYRAIAQLLFFLRHRSARPAKGRRARRYWWIRLFARHMLSIIVGTMLITPLAVTVAYLTEWHVELVTRIALLTALAVSSALFVALGMAYVWMGYGRVPSALAVAYGVLQPFYAFADLRVWPLSTSTPLRRRSSCSVRPS